MTDSERKNTRQGAMRDNFWLPGQYRVRHQLKKLSWWESRVRHKVVQSKQLTTCQEQTIQNLHEMKPCYDHR